MCVSLGLADSEYTLYTRGAGRVEVIELFEENLKAMGLLKAMSLSVVNSQGDNTRGFRKGQEKVIALVHLHTQQLICAQASSLLADLMESHGFIQDVIYKSCRWAHVAVVIDSFWPEP